MTYQRTVNYTIINESAPIIGPINAHVSLVDKGKENVIKDIIYLCQDSGRERAAITVKADSLGIPVYQGTIYAEFYVRGSSIPTSGDYLEKSPELEEFRRTAANILTRLIMKESR